MEQTESSKKVQKCFINSWRLVDEEFKKYIDNVKIGKKQLLSIIAHYTALEFVVTSNRIEDTELIEKLQHAIEMEKLSDETLLNDVIDILHNHFINIIVQIEKMFNVCKSMDLSLKALTKASAMSVSLSEMLEALYKFRVFFTDDHHGRKFTIDILPISKDYEKISNFWNASDVVTMKEDLDLILAMEE